MTSRLRTSQSLSSTGKSGYSSTQLANNAQVREPTTTEQKEKERRKKGSTNKDVHAKLSRLARSLSFHTYPARIFLFFVSSSAAWARGVLYVSETPDVRVPAATRVQYIGVWLLACAAARSARRPALSSCLSSIYNNKVTHPPPLPPVSFFFFSFCFARRTTVVDRRGRLGGFCDFISSICRYACIYG